MHNFIHNAHACRRVLVFILKIIQEKQVLHSGYTNRKIKILKHLQNKIRRGPWLEPTPVQAWVCPWWSYEDHIFTKGDSLLKFSSESADDSSDEFGSLLWISILLQIFGDVSHEKSKMANDLSVIFDHFALALLQQACVTDRRISTSIKFNGR